MHTIDQSTSRLLYRVSVLIIFSLACLALAVVGVVIVLVFHRPRVVTLAFPMAIITQVVAIAVAFRFRCRSCHLRIFMQGFRTLHTDRERLPLGIASWIAVAWQIVG